MVNPEVQCSSFPLRAASPLDAVTYNAIRRRLVLDACKWDPQVGDVQTIGRFPLIMRSATWRELSSLATHLAEETLAAEQELLQRVDLHPRLGLPMMLRHVLQKARRDGATPCAARVLRFDFHWTDAGWKISEVNSDVPGGFCEASELPALFATHYPQTRPAGNPGTAWANALAQTGGPVALLSAVGYMEDRQVLAYLAKLLDQRGVATVHTEPKYVDWQDGIAHFNSAKMQVRVAGIVRFFQAEWLNARRSPCFFVGGKTPVSNPGISVLTESKRFPLVWDQLRSDLPTWRALLPETRDPRDAPWRQDDQWLVKSAFCNTGDTVAMRTLLNTRQWDRVKRAIWLQPGRWVAQRRFAAAPLSSPAGDLYPCIGVYTINGQAAGVYGRYCMRPLVDYSAVDVAVLIEGKTAETEA